MAEKSDEIILEKTSLSELRARKARTQGILDYHWKYYSELAGQRKKIQEALIRILSESAIGPIERSQWQRAMKLKYALHPLSVVGSLSSQEGGRFSFGKKLNPLYFPSFPALYVAADRRTAEFELLCQDNHNSGLSNHDFSLTKTGSLAFVSVSFRLEKCFDLRESRALAKFTKKIRAFRLSPELRQMARSLDLVAPRAITTTAELHKSLLDPNWREMPMNLDVPSNSQIFGQLLSEAGIEGVLYPSRMTGLDSVAIFTRNLEKSDSWIKLDEAPLIAAAPSMIGAGNFQLAEMTAKDLGIGVSRHS